LNDFCSISRKIRYCEENNRSCSWPAKWVIWEDQAINYIIEIADQESRISWESKCLIEDNPQSGEQIVPNWEGKSRAWIAGCLAERKDKDFKWFDSNGRNKANSFVFLLIF